MAVRHLAKGIGATYVPQVYTYSRVGHTYGKTLTPVAAAVYEAARQRQKHSLQPLGRFGIPIIFVEDDRLALLCIRRTLNLLVCAG
jgi:hypothetical protein